MTRSAAAPLLLALAVAVAGMQGAQAESEGQPYAGLETRSIKALSGLEIADLRAGKGMGLALAAEMNGFPGPAHVLELAESLQLTAAQRREAGELEARVRAEAVRLGREVIRLEARIDRLFAAGQVDPDTLSTLLHEAARRRADLRFAHLAAHIEMRRILSEGQRGTYMTLRGYGSDASHGHGDGRAHERHGHAAE